MNIGRNLEKYIFFFLTILLLWCDTIQTTAKGNSMSFFIHNRVKDYQNSHFIIFLFTNYSKFSLVAVK